MVRVVGIDKEKIKKITCNECASKLEFVESEVESRSYSCCGKSESGRFITCPKCQSWIEID
jgi:uncharacterized protein with PIN domain